MPVPEPPPWMVIWTPGFSSWNCSAAASARRLERRGTDGRDGTGELFGGRLLGGVALGRAGVVVAAAADKAEARDERARSDDGHERATAHDVLAHDFDFSFRISFTETP